MSTGAEVEKIFEQQCKIFAILDQVGYMLYAEPERGKLIQSLQQQAADKLKEAENKGGYPWVDDAWKLLTVTRKAPNLDSKGMSAWFDMYYRHTQRHPELKKETETVVSLGS